MFRILLILLAMSACLIGCGLTTELTANRSIGGSEEPGSPLAMEKLELGLPANTVVQASYISPDERYAYVVTLPTFTQ